MENSSEIQFGSLIDLAPEDLGKAMATTVPFQSSTPAPTALKQDEVKGITEAVEALASTIAMRDSMMSRQLEEVTQRLEKIESTSSKVKSASTPAETAEDEDELMAALEEIQTRVRTPRNLTSQPMHKPRMKPTVFDGRSSWEDYRAQFEIIAELNDWDSVTSATYLAVSLSGPAREVLGDLSPRIGQTTRPFRRP